jgi:hypothetical protein
MFERGSLSLSDDLDESDRTEITAQEIDHMRALMLSEQSQGQIDHSSLVRTSEEQRCTQRAMLPDDVVIKEIERRRSINRQARLKKKRKGRVTEETTEDCEPAQDSRMYRRRRMLGDGYSRPLLAGQTGSAFMEHAPTSHYKRLPSKSELAAQRELNDIPAARHVSNFLQVSETERLLRKLGAPVQEETSRSRAQAPVQEETSRSRAQPIASASANREPPNTQVSGAKKSGVAGAISTVVWLIILALISTLIAFGVIFFRKRSSASTTHIENPLLGANSTFRNPLFRKSVTATPGYARPAVEFVHPVRSSVVHPSATSLAVHHAGRSSPELLVMTPVADVPLSQKTVVTSTVGNESRHTASVVHVAPKREQARPLSPLQPAAAIPETFM